MHLMHHISPKGSLQEYEKKLEVDGKEYIHQACTYARAWHAHRDRQVVNIMPPMAERMSSGSIKN